jgi:hypothetical protein
MKKRFKKYDHIKIGKYFYLIKDLKYRSSLELIATLQRNGKQMFNVLIINPEVPDES